AEWLRFKNLPLLLVAAEFNRLFATQFHASDLVRISRDQTLVAQVVQTFVKAAFSKAGDRKHLWVTGQLHVRAAARRSIVANQQFVVGVVLIIYRQFYRGFSETVSPRVGGLFFYQSLGVKRR